MEWKWEQKEATQEQSSLRHDAASVDEHIGSDHWWPNNDRAVKNDEEMLTECVRIVRQKNVAYRNSTEIQDRRGTEKNIRCNEDLTEDLSWRRETRCNSMLWSVLLPKIQRLRMWVTIWNGMTIMATNMSENANDTMKKFWTVRNGRKVKTERITRILPQIHNTTILERTNATGIASISGIARAEAEGELLELSSGLFGDGAIKDMRESTDEM